MAINTCGFRHASRWCWSADVLRTFPFYYWLRKEEQILDETRAVEPLERTPQCQAVEEVPETYPSAL